jgi:hypothetical protein
LRTVFGERRAERSTMKTWTTAVVISPTGRAPNAGSRWTLRIVR